MSDQTRMSNSPNRSRPGGPPARPGGPPARSGGNASGGGRSGGLDPIRVLRQHVLGIIVSGIVGACVGTGAYFLLLMYFPRYSSEIMFEVRPGLKEATEIGTQTSLSDDDVERVARTQTKLITQRDVLEQAVQDPAVRSTEWMKKNFTDTASGQPLVELATDELEEDLWTPVYRNTNLFSLAWSAPSAADVPKVLDAIAKAYNFKLKQLDERQFSDNENLFEDQLRRTRHALQDLRDEIQGFIVSKGITTLDDPRFSATAAEVDNLTQSLTNAMNDLTSAESQYLQAAAKLEGTMEPTSEDVVEAELDPALAGQIQVLESLRAEERSLRQRFHSNSNPIRQIEASIAGTEQQIDAKTNELLKRNLNARMRQWSSEMTRLQSLIKRIETDLSEKDERMRSLASDASLFESYVSQRTLLEKQRDEHLNLMNSVSLMKLRADAGRVRQVGPAKFPRMVAFPKYQVIIPAGVVGCVGLYVLFIFLRALTDQRIHTPSDLLVIPGTRLIGVMPDIDEDPADPESAELVRKDYPDSVLAESYRQAWNGIWRGMTRQGYASLMLVSGMPGSGTTTVLTNLALSAAAGGLKVVVVDGNFRKPRLGSVFGLEDDDHAGLGELITDAASIEDATQRSDGVAVITAGRPANRIYERFSDAKLASVMAELRTRYDCILVDAAPAVAAGDAMVLANKVESVALVVRAGAEERGLVARLVGQFRDTPADLLGVILNRPRQTAGGYFKKNYRLMAKYTAIEE